jgi:hypothetical protein
MLAFFLFGPIILAMHAWFEPAISGILATQKNLDMHCGLVYVWAVFSEIEQPANVYCRFCLWMGFGGFPKSHPYQKDR